MEKIEIRTSTSKHQTSKQVQNPNLWEKGQNILDLVTPKISPPLARGEEDQKVFFLSTPTLPLPHRKGEGNW